MSSMVEQQARATWLVLAIDVRFARCDGCGRVKDENDKPLLVARQHGSRKFECLECHEFGAPA